MFFELANQVVNLKTYPYFDIANNIVSCVAMREDLSTGKF